MFISVFLQTASALESDRLGSDNFSQPAAMNWPTVGGDWSNSRYSALTQINIHNVHALGATWVSDKFDDGSTSSVTPIIKDGVMFVTAGRRVYALNAKTGRTIWSYKTVPDTRPEQSSSNGEMQARPSASPNSRGVAIGQGLIFVGLMDGKVIALKQQTGELVWIQQTGIDEAKKWQMSSPAPTYTAGVVLTGLSNGDVNLRGRVTALDASTGNIRWQFYSVPSPGEVGHETWAPFNDAWKVGGGGVWTNAAVDAELGTVYFTTGNPVPAFAGDWRPGANLYTCSVLAIDIKTGELKWHYQLVHHDVFEADAGTPVVLYDMRVNGRMRKALAAIRADGYIFQLDRETGKPLLPIEERPVPQLESQKTWPTQPFPVIGESVLLTCDDWRKRGIPSGFSLGCMWTPPASPPPSKDPQNVIAPFPSVRLSPMAYSPQHGYFYAQNTSFLWWPRRSQDPYHLTFDYTPLYLPAYAELAAIDGRTGRLAWKKPIHTSNGPQYWRGGLLATAGGLLLRSAGDGNVEARDARTGDVLWNFQTGIANGRGSPVSYEIDATQYIAVPVGHQVWAFKLGGKIPAAPPPLIASEHDEFSGPVVDADRVETTSFDQQQIGSGTRYFIDEFTFSPPRARITAGTRLMFVNNGVLKHEMVALDNSWETGPIGPAQEAWVTFDKPGKYPYICKEHPWSYGEIIVVDRASSQHESAKETNDARAGTGDFAEQAIRGEDHFKRHCSACHGEDLRGRPPAPPLMGTVFTTRWRDATTTELFDNIRTTMPQGNPGGLDTDTYMDIVVYLLRANDMAMNHRKPPSSESDKHSTIR